MSHRRWILLKALLIPAALNLVLTAGVAWFGARGQSTVPLYGVPLVETSTFCNSVGTLFILPLITCVLTTVVIRREVGLGSLASVSHLRSSHTWLAMLPATHLSRGLILGAIAVAAFAPPLILAFVISGFPELSRDQFVLSQAAFAVLIGAVITPFVALYAMADPSDDEGPAPLGASPSSWSRGES